MSNIRTYLNIIEISLRDSTCNPKSSTVPSDLIPRITLMDIASQPVHRKRLCIAPHESDASDVSPELSDKRIDCSLVERVAYVFSQIGTVAPWAMARTVRNIHRERRLVRNFLKDDARIYILKHDNRCLN